MTISLQKFHFIRKYLGLYLQSKIYSAMHHSPLGNPVSIPHSSFHSTGASPSDSVFQALQSAFTVQFNEAACSVASMATVLKAARVMQGQDVNSVPITQEEILNRVRAANWAERISPKGHQNRRGLPVDMLGLAAEEAFTRFQVPVVSMQAVPLFGTSFNPEESKKQLFQRLSDFQNSTCHLLIAHFNQGVFIKGLHLPHISPIGNVDVKQKMVCILDVDPDIREPYWVSYETFWKGISWRYNGVLRRHGYDGGGYIWIQLKTNPSQND